MRANITIEDDETFRKSVHEMVKAHIKDISGNQVRIVTESILKDRMRNDPYKTQLDKLLQDQLQKAASAYVNNAMKEAGLDIEKIIKAAVEARLNVVWEKLGLNKLEI